MDADKSAINVPLLATSEIGKNPLSATQPLQSSKGLGSKSARTVPMDGEDSGTEGRSEWPQQITQHYQSQGQVQLNEFMGKFKQSSATTRANEREKQGAVSVVAGSDSDKEEVVAKHDDQQKGFNKKV